MVFKHVAYEFDSVKHLLKHRKIFLLFSCSVTDVLHVWTDTQNMLEARMRTESTTLLYLWIRCHVKKESTLGNLMDHNSLLFLDCIRHF